MKRKERGGKKQRVIGIEGGGKKVTPEEWRGGWTEVKAEEEDELG